MYAAYFCCHVSEISQPKQFPGVSSIPAVNSPGDKRKWYVLVFPNSNKVHPQPQPSFIGEGGGAWKKAGSEKGLAKSTNLFVREDFTI